jgi:hypothetical protein
MKALTDCMGFVSLVNFSVSVIFYFTGKLKKRSRWTTITLYQTADRIKAYIW